MTSTPVLRLVLLVSLSAAALHAGPLSGGTRPERGRQRSEATQTGPTGAHMSAQQKANLQKLQADLASIKSGWAVTPEQKAAVKNSLAAIADGATKPSEESVTALADSLTAALSDKSVSPQEKAQISKNVQAVLQSANIPPGEVEALIASTSAMLSATGVTKTEAETLAADLRAIATELKTNVSAAAAAH